MQQITMKHDHKTNSFERACEDFKDGKGKSEDLSRFHLLEFQPEWLDEEGLPTKLGEWIGKHLTPSERYRGARLGKHGALDFTIHAKPALVPGSGPVNYRAVFRLENDRKMVVIPGMIEVFSEFNDELLARYIECFATEGTTWKIDLEVRKVYLRNYHDCPAILARAYQFIDTMAYELCKDPHRRPSTLLSMLGPTHLFQDSWGCKLTPNRIENVFHFLASLYHGEGDKVRRVINIQLDANDPDPAATVAKMLKEPTPVQPGEVDSAALWEMIRRIALGELDRHGNVIDEKTLPYQLLPVTPTPTWLSEPSMAIKVTEPKKIFVISEWPRQLNLIDDLLNLTQIRFRRSNGEEGEIKPHTHMHYHPEKPHLMPPGRQPQLWMYRTHFSQPIPGYEQYGHVEVRHSINATTGSFESLTLIIHPDRKAETVEVLDYTVVLHDPHSPKFNTGKAPLQG